MDHEVATRLAQVHLFETIGAGEFEGMTEIRGRVDKEHANQWGSFVRNVLRLMRKARKPYCVDFSRVYYLVTVQVEPPSIPGASGPGKMKAGRMSEERLVQNWRLKFDRDGEAFLMEEINRIALLGAKQQMMARGQIPMPPASVPGIEVVECGMGHPGTGIPERR